MKHTLKEIVQNDNIAVLDYVCNGIVYYNITVDDTIYQLELDTTDDVEFKNVYFTPTYKTIHLMRWIRKSINDDKLIIIK